MAVGTNASTLGGGVTPICNDCGVSLCWDISLKEYLEDMFKWDNWKCRDCRPSININPIALRLETERYTKAI